MATNFPIGLDNLGNPGADTPLNDPTYKHSDQHANANDAIEALQAKVGIDNSVDSDSLDYKVRSLEESVTDGSVHVVTSSTRPTLHATPSVSEGLTIYETDTNKLLIWDGSAWLPPHNLPWGRIASTIRTSNQGTFSSLTDLTDLSVTFTAVANRRYKVYGRVRFALSSGDQATVTVQIRNASNTVIQEDMMSGAASSGFLTFYPIVEVTPGAGSVTYKLSAQTNSGSITHVAAATAPGNLIVEDIGPA